MTDASETEIAGKEGIAQEPPLAFEHVPEDYFRPIALGELFGRQAPLELDLGCGDGAFLVAMAAEHPERNYFGTERLYGRAKNTARRAKRAGLTNLRLLRIESSYVATHLLPAESVSRFYLMFPDPWPKRRHWPRRLVQPAFLDAAAAALAPGGEFCIKTDDADYFGFIRAHAAGCSHFESHSWDEAVPQTDFEKHYAAQGRPFYSLRLVKR